ncbi:MAG: hypothetical protein MUF29_01135 [Chitinophagaceae bacterium]|nr:hypothetical protein [Chitinophagaceae bacterium]
MESLLAGLVGLPLAVSLLLLILPRQLAKWMVIAAAIILSILSVFAYANTNSAVGITLPHYINEVVAGADLLLLLFFGWIAIKRKSILVGLLTMLQLGGLVYLLNNMPATAAPQLMVDELSAFMFILINVISGIIAIYSLRYIEEEPCSPFRKKYFLSIIFWFIGAMNLVVCADNLEYFFLFFELTTLASFLLISFRQDAESRANAITALWMNQVGGLAILGAIFFLLRSGSGEASFSNLLALAPAGGLLLPLALLSMAALIKGAQLPFSSWLLGAMVAPTPVSALLHSSTMVKIAPFMILRLSPALKDTPLASAIIALTAFVFIAAAVGALAQDNFKRILAHSTIALLALMIMMGALGTPVTVVASLALMLFHGISKSMLFLNAGILERVFHLKNTSDMDRLGESGPFTALVTTIGFMSLLLPPFGAFIGKWLSIETLGSYAVDARLLGAFTLIAVVCGSAVLTLLYTKVIGLLIARSGEHDRVQFEKTGKTYTGTIYALLALIALSIFGLPLLLTHFFAPVAAAASAQDVTVMIKGWSIFVDTMKLPVLPPLIAFFLLPAAIIAAMFIHFRHVDRTREYMCGEKVNYSFSSFYLTADKATPYAITIGVVLFGALLVAALI